LWPTEPGYTSIMYIGIGTVVLILIILLIIFMARRV
jgi:hypothetical protein